MYVGQVLRYKDESLLIFVSLMFYPTVKHFGGRGLSNPSLWWICENSATHSSKILSLENCFVLFYFILKSKNKMKVCPLLGSFPGVTELEWARSLCSLSVLMCYVYSIPSSHIALPYSNSSLVWASGCSYLLLLHPHLVGDSRLPPCIVLILSTMWILSRCAVLPSLGSESMDHVHFSSGKWNLWCFFLCHLISMFQFWQKHLLHKSAWLMVSFS